MAQQPQMTFLQYEESLHWFFDKVEADAAQPQPRIRWLGEDAVVLQNGWPPGIAELPLGELVPTLPSLVKVLKHILNGAPMLTRVLLNQIATFLTDPARQAKTTRICAAFPNQEGFQQGSDGYLSLIDCIRAVYKGADLCLYKHRTGMEWLSRWEKCKQQLHVCASTIPKVTLDSRDRESLVIEGKELVELQTACWDMFVAWVTERLADTPDGFRNVTLIYPNLREREINWDTTLAHLKGEQFDRCFVWASPDNISPGQFRGLKSVFDDCDRVLVAISNSKESKANVCSARSTVIEGDVDILLLEISAKRRVPGIGSPTRNCWLDEMKSLFKRIDQARETGCHLDPSLKARLNAEKALLMEDGNLAKMDPSEPSKGSLCTTTG